MFLIQQSNSGDVPKALQNRNKSITAFFGRFFSGLLIDYSCQPEPYAQSAAH
jgi:hypothetical protein